MDVCSVVHLHIYICMKTLHIALLSTFQKCCSQLISSIYETNVESVDSPNKAFGAVVFVLLYLL